MLQHLPEDGDDLFAQAGISFIRSDDADGGNNICGERYLRFHIAFHRWQSYALSSVQGQSGASGERRQPLRIPPQYSALEAIYEKYKDKGFLIAGFPANNFGAQEPGTNAEIKTFCSLKYNVTFPMYSKVSVKGDDQTPLYQYLTKDTKPPISGDIKWNFTKFLVDKNGNVVQRFEPNVTPDSPEVTSAIEKLLKE